MSSPDSPGTPSHHAGPSRAGFSSSLGVLAATLGSAVGLGNIWKFPSLTGANGGAGFLLVYLLSTLLIGLPLMVAEIAIGRQARANPISALRQWKAQAEEAYVRRVWAVSGGDVRKAATRAGISRGHWYELMKKCGL